MEGMRSVHTFPIACVITVCVCVCFCVIFSRFYSTLICTVWLVAFICAHSFSFFSSTYIPIQRFTQSWKFSDCFLFSRSFLNLRICHFSVAAFNLLYFDAKQKRELFKMKTTSDATLNEWFGWFWLVFHLNEFCLIRYLVCWSWEDFKKSTKINKIKYLDTTHTHHNKNDYVRLFSPQSTVFRFSLSREATSLCWDDEKSFYATHPNSRRWTREIYIVRVRAFRTEKTASSTALFSLFLGAACVCIFQLPDDTDITPHTPTHAASTHWCGSYTEQHAAPHARQ